MDNTTENYTMVFATEYQGKPAILIASDFTGANHDGFTIAKHMKLIIADTLEVVVIGFNHPLREHYDSQTRMMDTHGTYYEDLPSVRELEPDFV